MKNIHSVLDSQETEAWQKLIRVLTHEIMNSITPVTSLSELLEHQIEDFDGNEEERAEIRRMYKPSAGGRRVNSVCQQLPGSVSPATTPAEDIYITRITDRCGTVDVQRTE